MLSVSASGDHATHATVADTIVDYVRRCGSGLSCSVESSTAQAAASTCASLDKGDAAAATSSAKLAPFISRLRFVHVAAQVSKKNDMKSCPLFELDRRKMVDLRLFFLIDLVFF